MGSNEDVLDGWTEIAEHFGKSVRTVQRWEKELGLPVRRLQSADVIDSSGRVFAYREELEEWRRTQASRATDRARSGTARAWKIALCLVAVSVPAALLSLAPTTPDPGRRTTLLSESGRLDFLDERGRVVWSRQFPGRVLRHDFNGDPVSGVEDLDGDGRLDVWVAVRPTPAGGNDRLMVLDDSGATVWEYWPGSTIDLDGVEFDGKFSIFVATVLQGGQGLSYPAVVANHTPRHASRLVVLSPHGEPVAEYWHPGYVFDATATDVDGDGSQELAFVGVNSDLGRPVAGILKWAGDSDVNLLVYRVYDRSTVSTRIGFPNRATRITATADGFEINVSLARPDELLERVYLLDRDLEVAELIPTREFEELHALQLDSGAAPWSDELSRLAEPFPTAQVPGRIVAGRAPARAEGR